MIVSLCTITAAASACVLFLQVSQIHWFCFCCCHWYIYVSVIAVSVTLVCNTSHATSRTFVLLLSLHADTLMLPILIVQVYDLYFYYCYS